MTAQIKIDCYTNLGAAMWADVIGHESVRGFSVAIDYGHSTPDWPRLQTLPDNTFSLNPETGGYVYQLLRDGDVVIFKHRHNPGHSFVQVMPGNALKAMRLLGFGQDIVAQTKRMKKDAANRRAAYLKNLQPSYIRELKELDCYAPAKVPEAMQRISGRLQAFAL